ncbi:MAG: glutathione-disulfide reductase, partial [Rhizobiales bacterium]|nr:glutathione-disulfide reductase [Hyphomicrobiales bacterium]
VTLCEAGRLGGTCVIRGCVPKKLMRYGAFFSEHFKAARAYGWGVGDPRLDWEHLINARNQEITRLNGIYRGMLEKAGVQIVEGRGKVTGPNEVEVDGRTFTAERILVAVGARPSLLDVPGIEHVITSNEALEGMTAQPRRLAVMGAGYIGVELASIFQGLGVETSIFFRKSLPLAGFDQDVRQALVEQYKVHGLDVRAETTIEAIEPDGDDLRVRTSAGEMRFDTVLYATGRHPIPNTEKLGLHEIGVAMDETGAIHVDRSYRSSVPGIYAVGDCSDHAGAGVDSGAHDLTPVAIAEGRAIAEALFNDNPREVRYDTIPTAVFSIPEAGTVGLSEEQARQQGHDVTIYRTGFRPMLHTLTGEPVRIMMKLVVDAASDRVLGAHMVGDDAGEIIQGLAVAMTAGATKADFDATVGLHPSAAEEFVTMYQPSA